MGNDSQQSLLNEMENWPTYYPYQLVAKSGRGDDVSLIFFADFSYLTEQCGSNNNNLPRQISKKNSDTLILESCLFSI